MKVGFVSDFDFYTDGRQLYVNRAAALMECISSSVEEVVYFGRVLPATRQAALVPLSALNFKAVNLRTRKHGALLDAPVVAYRIWKHRSQCDTFVLKLGNLHAFIAFWVLKLSGRHVVCYAINDVFIPQKTQGGFARRLRWAYALTLTFLTRLMFTMADGRLALTPSIGRRLLLREREFVTYVESSFHERDIVGPTMQREAPRCCKEILTVGRLVPYKGHEFLIKAIHSLASQGVNVHLNIVGEGWFREALERLVEELSLGDRVSFLGHVPNGPALWALYRHADVFVLPSVPEFMVGGRGYWVEALGLVLLEAMSNGTPVIASAVGGIPDVIHDSINGLLVRPGNVDELKAAIARLLDDQELRRRLIEAGLETARTFAVERQTQILVQYLRKTVTSKEGASSANGLFTHRT